MKSLKLFLLPVLDSLEFGWQVIRYALIFVSVFFRQRTSLGCEIVAIRSQLTFYEESIRQKRQPRPRSRGWLRLQRDSCDARLASLHAVSGPASTLNGRPIINLS